ncbi:hypothetical protein H6P81_009391 [Aristolochia fimbriata]|uniref:Armadillo repeat-containing protein 8 n=1 Tax=Aristolochia fimbriata TaxID=158543 RepID=A0AAV7ENF5_ARIFI|nr:hypothetical protein H6P81_009391 [Aristolochia fimbriata]
MPASAAGNRPEELCERLASVDSGVRLKALREIKNQIIGNRTKKLTYIKLGAVPRVAAIVGDDDSDAPLFVQSAAALGSFACGVDIGVKTVLKSGAFPHLIRILSNQDEKVVDASARSLRMIFQSKLAPKYDFLNRKDMDFILSLLNSVNENVTELAASIIAHSCQTGGEQKALSDEGVLQKLMNLLTGSINQRDASLDAFAAIFRNNSELISKFAGFDNGRKTLGPVVELLKDKYPRTRLLASVCLIVIGQASPCHLEELGVKTKLIPVLVELLEEPGQPGDDAPFTLANFVAGKEELQKLAFDANAVEKLCKFLRKTAVQPKRFEGLLLALSELCSKLEICRNQFHQLQVLHIVIDALKHDSTEVRSAACYCLRSITRSVKSLSAGDFTNETILVPLVQLLRDPSTSVQVAALGPLSNIAVDFTPRKAIFVQCGIVKEIIQLSKSMDSAPRLNAVWALRNLMFLSDKMGKESILIELTLSTLASLICDSEVSIQEQALGLVCNLLDGSIDSIEYAFAEDGKIIKAVARQVKNATNLEVCIQGMYVLSNIAAGNELHKEAVMDHIIPPVSSGGGTPIITSHLRSSDSRLRTASTWCIVNLTHPTSTDASDRIARLRNAGVIGQIKSMVNDPCLDVKFRVRTALEQCTTFGNAAS